ncbi:MAG: hypothetical protein BGN88_14095 [Clostridiales bacterium 43-6]|nr:MAG: hypothetical protein BGN88_14095 [Clostridiales bacterium 43-6]
MNQVRVLFVTIDDHRKDEIKESFSVASIVSYCQNKGVHWTITKLSIDSKSDVINQINDIQSLFIENDLVFFGLYIWSEQYAPYIINSKQSNNKLIFGGYSVCNTNVQSLVSKYPDVDHFIVGYAEEAVYQLVSGYNLPKIIIKNIDNAYLGRIYANNVLSINESVKSVRFYSGLGCVYHCEYCAHRDNNLNSMHEVPLPIVFQDIDYIHTQNIHKVNFIDPTFNIGVNYLKIVEHLIEIQYTEIVSFQVNFSSISNDFIELCRKLNCILEFGIQDIDEYVTEHVNRVQDMEKVSEIIDKLNLYQIKHELSFIFGLPYQSTHHIDSDLLWLSKKVNPKLCKVRFNRLMLLPGTRLYTKKAEYEYEEEYVGGIPFVKSSKWISKSEMHDIVHKLIDLNYFTK